MEAVPVEERYDCHTRMVHIDKSVKRGTVELPAEFFEHTGIEPGHHVVLDVEGEMVKVKSKLNEMLKRSEVGVTPLLSSSLGLTEGQMVCVGDRTTMSDRLFDEVEDVFERLGLTTEQVRDSVEDAGDRVEEEYRKVRDRIAPDRSRPKEKGYIEVPPDLDDVAASPPEEPIRDIREQVDVWTPDDDGDGVVPVYRPGKDEKDEGR